MLDQAREMHRKGQWYLDWVMVTNGAVKKQTAAN